jgi:ubiquilin
MEGSDITISVKHLSSRVYEITINPRSTVEQLKMKVSELSKVDVAGIKLIFRGKILKDNTNVLSDLGITTGHTIHMVKNKTKSKQTQPLGKTPGQEVPGSNPNQPGQNPFSNIGFSTDPTSARPAPSPSGLGGLGNMGGRSFPDMQNAMNNPQMREMMQNLLSNPEMLRNMINNNPMLQGMIQNNPQLQAMLDNPDMLRNMASMMQGGQLPGFPGMNLGTMPQNPGTSTNTNATPPGNTTQTSTTQSNQPGTTPPPPNMGNPNLPGFSGQNRMPDLNAMMNDPNFQARLNQFQQMYGQPGGQGLPNLGNFGGLGGLGGLNAPIPPQNVANPEETYKEQLAQLEAMGFTNRELNITVLKQVYGNVQMAIEKLINM